MRQSPPYRIVLIDDEQEELEKITRYITEKEQLKKWIDTIKPVLAFPDISQACSLLSERHEDFDIVLADLYMPVAGAKEALPDGGYQIIETLAKIDEEDRPQLVVISGKPLAERGIDRYRAMYRKWFRYLQKPASPETIHMQFEDVENWKYGLEWAIADLTSRYMLPGPSELQLKVVNEGPKMKECWRLIEKAGSSDIPVLLLGESGVGKSFFAKTIHKLSVRKNKEFHQINCAAIPGSLAESELFGHEPGAIPGTTQRRAGMFEKANEGTLFLDEVGELMWETQAKLLRVLQEKTFERLGGSETLTANARLIFATLWSLDELVAQKKFRNDLLARINVFPIYIPPLSERREEILALAKGFINQYRGAREILEFSSEATLALTSYHWPENIRGLENMIRRAIVLCDGEVIEVGHLTVPISSYTGQKPIMEEPSVSAEIRTRSLTQGDVVRVLRAYEDLESPGHFHLYEAARILGCSSGALKRMLKEWKIESEFPPSNHLSTRTGSVR